MGRKLSPYGRKEWRRKHSAGKENAVANLTGWRKKSS